MNQRQYCCEIKKYCEAAPEQCPIARKNKDIAEFEEAMLPIRTLFKNSLDAIMEWISRRLKK